jgi:hypothetical protein
VKIGFATRDWVLPRTWEGPLETYVGPAGLGGSGWYRCQVPARWLAEAGLAETVVGWLWAEVASPTFAVRTPAGEIHRDCDVIVMQRFMHEVLVDLVPRARAAGQVVLQDVDDWWWGLDPSNAAWWSSHPRHHAADNREAYRRVIAASDGVICSTDYLAERVGPLVGNRPTMVLRNFDRPADWPVRAQQDPPTIGWVGALAWRSRDVEVLRGTLGPFVERHGLQVFHGGHMEPSEWPRHAAGPRTFAEAAGVDPARMVLAPRVPPEEVPRLFSSCDIGLVPMRETPFNMAKSAVKGVSWALAGVPFVASWNPEYERLAARGIGRVARRPRDWLRHLEALLDPELRRAEAVAQRRRAEALVAEEAAAWAALLVLAP